MYLQVSRYWIAAVKTYVLRKEHFNTLLQKLFSIGSYPKQVYTKIAVEDYQIWSSSDVYI